MRSITAWLLLASVHQERVPAQVTAAGSCTRVTRRRTTPRGIPSRESVDANSEERNVVAAAMDRVNCRRSFPFCLTPPSKVASLVSSLRARR